MQKGLLQVSKKRIKAVNVRTKQQWGALVQPLLQ